MLSLAIQPSFSASASFKPSALSYHTLKLVAEIPFKSSISARPKATSFQSMTLSVVKVNRVARRNAKLSAYSAAAVDAVAEGTSAENSTPSTQLKKEKLGVTVKPMQRPRLVLKFIWMEKNIGLGLNQVIPGHGTILLSPYYFWPRKEAWEELKVLLESKPWISQKQMIILLNQATDIINLWQQSGGDLS